VLVLLVFASRALGTEGIATAKLAKTKGHHTWTDEEIAQYRAHWPLGTQQRLVMEFALETAFSNRPFGVKRIQTFHSRSVDVAREAALLSGIGTKGPSNMGSEDEVEQSRARPCRE
jgi:hypothetical protein